MKLWHETCHSPGDVTCVLSITEAFAGSDVAGLRTTAVLDSTGERLGVRNGGEGLEPGLVGDLRSGKPIGKCWLKMIVIYLLWFNGS